MQVTKHIAIACRISKDDERRGEGVADQERWGRGYVARTWPDLPVVVYTDNSISAADRETERPEFDRLLDDIRAGKVAHIVTYNRNRLSRDAAEWFDLVDDVLLPAGIEEIHTKHKGVQRVDDIATDFDAVLGRREVRVIRQLVRDKHANLADEGRPSGGAQVGYRPGRDEQGRATLIIEPREADAIRWACDAVLAGWSLAHIGAEWDRRGIKHPRGGTTPWAKSTAVIRRLLVKPSLAGLRSIRGVSTRPATWEPIVPEATWRAVKATLESRSHSNGTDGQAHRVVHAKRPARRYLLTGGIAVCGREGCGAPLVGQQRRWKNSPLIPYYACHPSKGGCSRLGIAGEGLEEEVTRRLHEHIDELGDEFTDALAQDEHEARRDEIVAEMKAVDGRRAEAARRWALDKLAPVEWDAARETLDAESQRLSGELAALPAPAASIDPQAIRDGWDSMVLDERRRAVELFIGHGGVVVMPARPGARFDPERIVIPEWRI